MATTPAATKETTKTSTPKSASTSSSAATTPASGADVDAKTYAFIASWLVFITLLIGISKTRIGYVLIYYGLLLLIFGILLTEYTQVAPLLNPPTISELEAQS